MPSVVDDLMLKLMWVQLCPQELNGIGCCLMSSIFLMVSLNLLASIKLVYAVSGGHNGKPLSQL